MDGVYFFGGKKSSLEIKINDFEGRVDLFKQSTLFGGVLILSPELKWNVKNGVKQRKIGGGLNFGVVFPTVYSIRMSESAHCAVSPHRAMLRPLAEEAHPCPAFPFFLTRFPISSLQKKKRSEVHLGL